MAFAINLFFKTVDQKCWTNIIGDDDLPHSPGIDKLVENWTQQRNGNLDISCPKAASHFTSIIRIADKMDQPCKF
jgi:hypothetical protein